jgi:hypothetical protein
VDKNDNDRHDGSCEMAVAKKMCRFAICRRATYSYVLVGGAVAENKTTENKQSKGEQVYRIASRIESEKIEEKKM